MPVCDAGRLIPERFSGRVVCLLLCWPRRCGGGREGRVSRPRAGVMSLCGGAGGRGTADLSILYAGLRARRVA